MYSLTGSLLLLVGILGLYLEGGHSFDMLHLARQSYPTDTQAWIFLAAAGGFAVYYWRSLRQTISGWRRSLTLAWASVFIVLLAGSLYYPPAAAASKGREAGGEVTLDGLAFLKGGHGAEYEAIEFVKNNVSRGSAILEAVGVNEAGPVGVLIAICVAFFIACMFVDPIVVILVLTPIFAPAIQATGLDPVLVGVLITLQVAIGSATPPFGCDIFTAIAIFKRPYMEVIRGTPPFIFMLVAAAGLIIAFPDIALFLRDIAFRD